MPAQKSFHPRVYIDKDLFDCLKKIDTLIINETSIVSAKLLDFISNIFASIHNNAIPFSRINIILIDDFTQLPPVTGQTVFHATT